jgi:hypothetical protein
MFPHLGIAADFAICPEHGRGNEVRDLTLLTKMHDGKADTCSRDAFLQLPGGFRGLPE